MPNFGSERLAKYLPNRLIRTRGSKHARKVYLTFDDGPHSTFTPQLMQLLDQFDVKASFFCIGKNAAEHPDVVRDLVAEGHDVCNHSFSHFNYRKMSAEERENDISLCTHTLLDLGVSKEAAYTFRAPQGQLSLGAMLQLSRGWDIVHWSYDSLDYRGHSLEAQLLRFETQTIENGDILLFHDDSDLCIRSLEVLIPKWLERGFSFERVSEIQLRAIV